MQQVRLFRIRHSWHKFLTDLKKLQERTRDYTIQFISLGTDYPSATNPNNKIVAIHWIRDLRGIGVLDRS